MNLLKIAILNLMLMSLNVYSQKLIFPFGEKLKNVVQKDTTSKRVFILGVYASAVHAKWVDNQGEVLVKALAVASEPEIFWNGNIDDAEKIINNIYIPSKLGKLLSADEMFNGPSGRSLDSNYLLPLGLSRKEVWLCDLISHSCQNKSQLDALKREYDKYIESGILPRYNIPEVPKILASDERIKEILAELKHSTADTIILLGDQPIKYFLSKYTDKYKKLSDFEIYGKAIDVTIDNKTYKVIALAHPRQVSKLGKSNQKWFNLHQTWLKKLMR